MKTVAFVLSVALAWATDAAPTVDRWLLDGHGNSRFEFRASSSNWLVTMDVPSSCSFLQFYTPFSSYLVDAGAVISPVDGTVHVPVYCEMATLCALDSGTGVPLTTMNTTSSSFSSYLRYLPDGNLVVGVDAGVAVYDPHTLEQLYVTSAIIGGYGGAQVFAVSKTNPPQLQTAGGGGPNWWGAACDLPAAAANGGVSYPFTNCAGNSDSTVNMGANGVTMYNNERFENPGGAVRYSLPMPSNPVAFNSPYVSWPWWIRSDFAGNTYVFTGTDLYKYAKSTKQLWTVPLSMGDQATLVITDDESKLLLSNTTNLYVLSPKSGDVLDAFDFVGQLGYDSCWAAMSPWAASTPVPMPDNDSLGLVCTKGKQSYVALLRMSTGDITDSVAIGFQPGQVLFDSSYGAYVLGKDAEDYLVARHINLVQ